MSTTHGFGSDRILQRMLSLHPKFIDLTLDRCWRLLERLGNPKYRLPPVVHIAGTNGKGSTLAMVRAGLEGAGLRAHCYTSPHLSRFHERIRLAGHLIEEPALETLLNEVYDANDGQQITYFEITTVAAMLAMARTPADFTLLEVGLGGRLDATNVIETPRASVITPVDLDHQDFLGDTLAAIAAEKAGIIKRGVPCVIGPQLDDALSVIEARAARLGAPVRIHGQHWHVGVEDGRLVYQDETGLCDLPLPALVGPHQISNAGVAVAVLRELGVGDPESAMRKAQWPARMQRLRTGPLVEAASGWEVWLDGGHNPAAGRAVGEALSHLPKRPTYLICGMLNTKDAAGFLAPIKPHVQQCATIAIPAEENAIDAASLAIAGASVGIPSSPAPNIEAALSRLVGEHKPGRILICGSLHLAGHVLKTHG